VTWQIASLRNKLVAGEEAANKLAQKQDTVVQLRKQIRAKDETIRTWQQRVEVSTHQPAPVYPPPYPPAARGHHLGADV
jgi:hypothetical protein